MGRPPNTPGHAVLDVLRPPPEMRASLMLGGSYSLDPVVLAAMLATLCGAARSDLAHSRAAFAEAVTTLRGRAFVVVHPGRVLDPRHPGPLHAVLGRFVVPASVPNERLSWHPKVLLVRFEPRDVSTGPKGPVWRVWLGSRNLVRAPSWELGLWTETDRKGAVLPGIATVLDALGAAAGLGEADLAVHRSELRELHWTVKSDGNELQQVQFRSLAGVGPLWRTPRARRSTWVVSPFLSARSVKQLARERSEDRPVRLVSTRTAVDKVARTSRKARAALVGLDKIYVVEPPPGDEGRAAAERVDDDTLPIRGLHAKARFDEVGRERWLATIGSANFTSLGVGTNDTPANAEIVAHLRLSRAVVSAILDEAILRNAVQVRPEDLTHPDDPPPEPTTAERLETAGDALTQRWRPRQVWGDGRLTIEGAPPWSELTSDVQLAVAPVASTRWTRWHRNDAHLRVPSPPPRHARSRWLRVRLSTSLDADIERRIVLDTVLEPSRTDADDHLALAQVLGRRGIHAWLLALLRGVDPSDAWDGSDEDDDRDSGDGGRDARDRTIDVPTLEEVLSLYASRQGAQQIARVDERIRAIQAVLERLKGLEEEGLLDTASPTGASLGTEVDAFLGVWRLVREVMAPRSGPYR